MSWLDLLFRIEALNSKSHGPGHHRVMSHYEKLWKTSEIIIVRHSFFFFNLSHKNLSINKHSFNYIDLVVGLAAHHRHDCVLIPNGPSSSIRLDAYATTGMHHFVEQNEFITSKLSSFF